MAKTLSTIISENKENIRDLHGTPYLIIHDRNNMFLENEEPKSSAWDHGATSAWHNLAMYPNQNSHLSGNVPHDMHMHMTHLMLSDLHSKSSLDDTDTNAIYNHTVSSRETNDALWRRHTETDPAWAPDLPKSVPHLDKALKKFKVPVGGLTTFSGLQSDPSESAKKHPENKLFLPSYTSTTINPPVTYGFSKIINPDEDTEVRHIMKFKFPEGMNVGSYISSMSDHPTEYEFLTRRGMSVHLNPEPEVIPYKSPIRGKRGQLKIWTAHPISFHEK